MNNAYTDTDEGWIDSAVLVTDIVGFESIFASTNSRGFDCRQVVQQMTNPQQIIEQAIKEHDGQIWPRAGDAVVAVFAPGKIDPAERAIRAVIQMHQAICEMRRSFSVIAGLASGRVYAGLIGPADCRMPTVLGPAKASADSMLKLARANRVGLCMCEETNRRMSGLRTTRLLADGVWTLA